MNAINKKENLEKYQLVNQIIIYSLIFVGFVFFFFYYILGNLSEISAKKDELYTNISYFNKISKKGMSFEDFNAVKDISSIDDSYTKNILSSIDRDFFDTNFLNKTGDNYLSFLDKLKEASEKEYNSSEFNAKKTKLENMLPVYSDVSSILLTNSIDDSKLINNIEALLDKFNLLSSDGINISNLVPVEDDSENTKKTKSSLGERDFYYFSIPLNITGTKKDIIDFVHYLENVGSIKIDGENIVSYKDNFSQSSSIYDGQVAEIDSIKMNNYLDSDNATIVNGQDVLSFIKNNQGQEKFDISLTVKFFVKGLAGYKVQELVKNTSNKYQNLLKDINKTIKIIDQKNPNMLSIFTSLTSMKRYLETIKTDIDDAVKQANKRENMGDLYNKIYKIGLSIDNVESKFLQQKKVLESFKK